MAEKHWMVTIVPFRGPGFSPSRGIQADVSHPQTHKIADCCGTEKEPRREEPPFRQPGRPNRPPGGTLATEAILQERITPMARKNHQHQRPASRDSLSARYKDIGIKSVAAANIPVKEPKAANNPERHSRNHNDGRRKSIEDERERDKLSTNLADPSRRIQAASPRRFLSSQLLACLYDIGEAPVSDAQRPLFAALSGKANLGSLDGNVAILSVVRQ